MIPNVLAARYASPELVALWSPENKIVLERRLWIAVLRAQRDLGVDVPEQAIADYERVAEQVDLASIAARERVTRHDVKARIEEFCALAGPLIPRSGYRPRRSSSRAYATSSSSAAVANLLPSVVACAATL